MLHLLTKCNKDAAAAQTYGQWQKAIFWQSFFVHPPIAVLPIWFFWNLEAYGYALGFVWVLSFVLLNYGQLRQQIWEGVFTIPPAVFGRRLTAKQTHPTSTENAKPIDETKIENLVLKIGESAGWLHQKNHPRGIQRHHHLRILTNDLCQNTIIFGGIGSGKTVCAINRYTDQLMAYQDVSFLMFDIKGDFMNEAAFFAERHNRHLTIVGDGGVGFNILGGVNPALAASWLKSCFTANGQGKSGDGFWVDSAVALCQNVLNILEQTDENYSLYGLYQAIFKPEKLHASIDEVLLKIDQLSDRDQLQIAESIEWLKDVWGKNDEKLKQNITATISTVLSPFANVDLRLGFCKDSPDAFQMTDLLEKPTTMFLNLPMSKYGKEGSSLTYLLMKLAFMNMMRSRRANRELNQSRPVVFLCDEYQAIIDPISDLDFWDKSRSSKTIGIVSMQGVNSLYAALGNNRTVADAILQNFRNRWLFKTEDLESVQQAVRLLGQHDVEIESYSNSTGQSFGDREVAQNFKKWQQTGESFGESSSVSIQKEDVFSAAEIRSLPQFHALFIGSGGNGISSEDIFYMQPIFVNQ